MRKPVSASLIAALLISQQGFSFYRVMAQTVAPRVGNTAVQGPGIQAGAGTALSLTPSMNMTLTSPANLTPGSALPGVKSLDVSIPQASLNTAAFRRTPAAVSPAASVHASRSLSLGAALPTHTAEKTSALTVLQPVVTRRGRARAASFKTQSRAPAVRSGTLRGSSPARSLIGIGRRALSSIGAFSGRLFDGSREHAGSAAALPVERSKVKVYLTRHGQDPVSTDLKGLRGALESAPDYVEGLNRDGIVRLVYNKDRGALSDKDLEGVRSALAAHGIRARIQLENIPIDWARKEQREDAGRDGKEKSEARSRSPLWRCVIGPLTAPVRELAYLARTFKASLTWPTWGELAGGLLSKGPGVAMSVIWWAKIFLPSAPYAFAAALALTLALNVFHGIWINSWSNFQNNIGRQRGIHYQTFFNVAYTQSTAAMFRILTWLVVAGTIAPWTLTYWRDMGIVSFVGAFFGTLGFQGLNGLYDRGRIPRWGRSAVQQMRDLFFTLGGTFFGSGSMYVFWMLFILQQSLDFGLYLLSRRMKKRSIVYVADEEIAGTGEFQGMYPVKPGPEQSPLKQAALAVLHNPLFAPVVLPLKWLWKLIRKLRAKKTEAPR